MYENDHENTVFAFIPCSRSLETGIGFGTGSDDFKLARALLDFERAVDARLTEADLSVLRAVVALLILLLLILPFRDPSLRNALLLSLPDVEEVVATDPTFVLLDILLAFSLLSKFFDLDLLLSGSQTDWDLMVPKLFRRLRAVGTLRKDFLFASSSVSLEEEGKELKDESTMGSTLDILSQRLRIGSVPSASLTFSSDEIMGRRIGGSLSSLLVDVECDASVSCEALLSEKLTRRSEGFFAVELLCNFRIGDGFGVGSENEALSLLFLQSESSVLSACCKHTTTSGRPAKSNGCVPPLASTAVDASSTNSFSKSKFFVGLAAAAKHLFSDLSNSQLVRALCII